MGVRHSGSTYGSALFAVVTGAGLGWGASRKTPMLRREVFFPGRMVTGSEHQNFAPGGFHSGPGDVTAQEESG